MEGFRLSVLSSRRELAAVVFDVDGTLVDSERDGHRVAFNLAFEEFGLPYRWDESSYGDLLHITGGQRRIDRYLAEQGVEASEREALAPALHARKTEIIQMLVDEGRIHVRAGAERLLRELSDSNVRLAVATTGSRAWVDRLLRRVLPDIHFDVVVTGDEVANRKPDPEAFVTALERLGAGAENVVAVEDSSEGLQSAQGAGLRCAVIVNEYTSGHDLASADLVLDGFGAPGSPADVIADRRSTECGGVLDAATLRRLV
ncbi:MAG TPA: HAD-IA family hydrolase [Acidimicrobiales bacterium]|nr:HAD-IA family hydrolase [Acidimicrobiales bacterium]